MCVHPYATEPLLLRSPMNAKTHRVRHIWLAAAVFAVFALLGGLPETAAEADGRSRHDPTATGELLPPAGSPGMRAQSVIGTDERELILDTTVFPFSAIVFLELEDALGEVFGSCTATFIGPDALLTAGHCLWDAEAGTWGAEHIRVVPGKDGGFEPFGSEYASDWWVSDGYAETGLDEWDWGVIKLPNDAITLDTGRMSVAVADSEVLELPEFFPAIIVYPGDKPDVTMWGHIRQAFLAVEDFRLHYDIDTAPGQSGSAIWSAAEGPYLGIIVGIHTLGGLSNSGSRIDQEFLDDLMMGCEVMECTISVEDLAAPIDDPAPDLPELPFRSYGVALARD